MGKFTCSKALGMTFLLLLFTVSSFAQQSLTVSGHVRDDAGNGLLGATITVEGSTVGVSAGQNGAYSISVPSNGTLRFSFVGYSEQLVPVNGRNTINVTLTEDALAIEDVVVVGYGTQRKKDLTSAITVIDNDAMQRAPVGDINSALQGLAAGVEVQGNDGSPGSLPTVRIRGVSSTNDTNPLYVVDGIPMDGGAQFINPADVESMQVLKDAASAAIYGSRGANGVIIITTKQGKTGAPKVRYSGYYGFSEAWKKLDMLNPQQWGQLLTDSYANALVEGEEPKTPPPAAQNFAGGYNGPINDWQDAMFQRGAMYEQNVDISGGTDNGNYYFSVNQYGQDGIMINTPFKRYSVRMNSNWRAGNFRFGENIAFFYTQRRREANEAARSNLENVLKLPQSIPVYNENAPSGYSGYEAGDYGMDAVNPVAVANLINNRTYNKVFTANVFGEYEFIDGLTFRTTFGITSSENQTRDFTLKSSAPPNFIRANTTLAESMSWTYNWVWENMATYQKAFGDHDLTVMAGYTSEYRESHGFNASGQGFDIDLNDVLGQAKERTGMGGFENEIARASVLARINYIYKGKYMLTANVRRDGSSKFGPGNKYGTFPSASAAWRASDEPFLQNVSWLNNLKVRASYGVVGNDSPVGAYSYVNRLSLGQGYFFADNYNYIFDGKKVLGSTISSYANGALTWETIKQTDIGIDLGLFNNRLEITADWYDKRTEDMLIDRPLPPSIGAGSNARITSNLGSILNRGFEFSATWRKMTGDFQYSITGNFATLHNEVLDMSDNPIMAGAVEFTASGVSRTDVGHPIGSFYLYETDGIFQSTAEIDGAAIPTWQWTTAKDGSRKRLTQPGDIRFVDKDGNGVIDSDDLDYMGSPIPTLTYGLSANFAWKGFDLSLFFQGVAGNKIYSELLAWTEGMHTNFNQTTAVLDRWTPSNTNTDVPRALYTDMVGNISTPSTRYLFDGDYLRLKNVTLGYTLPQKWTNVVKLESVRVYLTGRNLLTFTKYPYYDPEIGSGAMGTGGSSNTSRGIDNGIYPQPRTLIFGVQIGF